MSGNGFREFPFYYWDILESKKDLNQTINIFNDQPIILESFSLSRDDEYRIVGKASGTLDVNNESPFADQRKEVPCKRLMPIVFRGDDDHYYYSIAGVYYKSEKWGWNGQDGHILKKKYDATFRASNFNKISKSDHVQVRRIVEWYLNGEDDALIFYRPTNYDYKKEQTINRGNQSKEVTLTNMQGNYSRDHVLIKLPQFSFIISRVLENFNPTWSKKTAIEYSTDDGPLPSKEIRTAIREFSSFLLGRQLITVGFSSYDANNVVVEQESVTPWGNNLRHLCNKGRYSPIMLHNESNLTTFEKSLEALLPQYLQSRDELQLDEVLWRYWIGSDLPIGSNIPIMASGVEILAKNWVKSTTSKTKGVYMDPKEYSELFCDEIKSFEQKLNSVTNGHRILNKVKGCYNMGQNEILDIFFDGIGIKFGELETKAFQARNYMIHGVVDLKRTSVEEQVLYTKAYRTMFNRIMLKILGYDGKYIDYTVEKCPERHIDEVASGP